MTLLCGPGQTTIYPFPHASLARAPHGTVTVGPIAMLACLLFKVGAVSSHLGSRCHRRQLFALNVEECLRHPLPTRTGEMEGPVHGLCSTRRNGPQLAPVDHLGGSGVGAARQPCDFLNRHFRAGHQGDEGVPQFPRGPVSAELRRPAGDLEFAPDCSLRPVAITGGARPRNGSPTGSTDPASASGSPSRPRPAGPRVRAISRSAGAVLRPGPAQESGPGPAGAASGPMRSARVMPPAGAAAVGAPGSPAPGPAQGSPGGTTVHGHVRGHRRDGSAGRYAR
jgi:hypothetical protein